MLIACFCGRQFKVEGSLARCPGCHETATLPHVSTAEANQMRSELETLLEQPAAVPER